MTTKLTSLFAAIGAIVIHGGCTLESGIDADLIDPDATLLQPEGLTFGSRTANGEENGFGRPGTEIFGPDATGTSADGRMLAQLGLKGSAIVSAVVESGDVLTGADLVGATFHSVTPAKDPIDIQITGLEPAPGVTLDTTVHRYTIAFRRAGDPVARYACGVDRAGIPNKAIPLEELWDYRQGVPGGGAKLRAPGWITFACEGFALARCVDLGYLAWNLPEGNWLATYHQACTRMMRADYCGDGRSFSQDNTQVNVYDNRSIQTMPSSLAPSRAEAEWNEQGARCVRRNRNALVPPAGCTFDIAPKLCGSPPHWDKTLLVSEMP